MATITASIAVATGWRSFAPASLDTTNGTPALTRDRAFTAFAGSILGALGSSADASATTSSGNRVNDVAEALRNALQNSTGGDAVGSLLGTIQAALSSASQSLSAAGFGTDAVQSLVTDFKNALSDQLNALAGSSSPAASAATPDPTTASTTDPTVVATPAPTPATTPATPSAPTPATTPAATPPSTSSTPTPAASPTAATGSSAFTASYRVTESGTIELVTTEGDVVKIGFRSSEGGSATGVSANGAAGLATYAAVSSYASTRFSVSVRGSLNADELKAVNDVLGQINTLASQFFSGNVSQAFASAAALNVDPNEIAGVALKLSERVSLRLATVGDAAGSDPSSASGTPASSASTTAAATPDTTASTTPADPTTTDPSGTTSTASSPSAPSTPTTTSVGGGISSLLSYLQQVLDVLGTTTTSGSVTFSAKAKLELLSSAVGAASLDPTESSAASLLKNVVGATTDATASAQPASGSGAPGTAAATA